jgi:hypothetical protein
MGRRLNLVVLTSAQNDDQDPEPAGRQSGDQRRACVHRVRPRLEPVYVMKYSTMAYVESLSGHAYPLQVL